MTNDEPLKVEYSWGTYHETNTRIWVEMNGVEVDF